jgi:hypothetical protein
MAINKRQRAGLLLYVTLGLLLASSSAGGKQEGIDSRQDYASARQDIPRFESKINDVINSSFSTSPFAVVQKAKGAYLQGYGFSFAFLVNIHRAVKNTPFGQVQTGANITQELKKQRIEELKEKLIQVLQNSGETFRMLRKEEYVTIIAYVEDRNFPDEPSANKTIVLSALKRDLDEFGRRSDLAKEFKQRMKIVEY